MFGRRKPQEAVDGKAKLDAAARKCLRRIARLQAQSTEGGGRATEWEEEFLVDVGARLQKFGRAFVDPEKGDVSLPVSIRQSIKLREIQRSLRKKRA